MVQEPQRADAHPLSAPEPCQSQLHCSTSESSKASPDGARGLLAAGATNRALAFYMCIWTCNFYRGMQHIEYCMYAC
jgi:hypothetical protein